MYLDMCPHVSLCHVSIWVYIGVCVSLIDGRIKTTSICGIITDHIVKELEAQDLRSITRIMSVGPLTTIRIVLIPGFGGLIVRPRICFRIGLLVWEAPSHQP